MPGSTNKSNAFTGVMPHLNFPCFSLIICLVFLVCCSIDKTRVFNCVSHHPIAVAIHVEISDGPARLLGKPWPLLFVPVVENSSYKLEETFLFFRVPFQNVVEMRTPGHCLRVPPFHGVNKRPDLVHRRVVNLGHD